MNYIDIAISEGAETVLGGGTPKGPEIGEGWFVEPTIFTGVKNDMRIAQEEVFGPVLSVIPFKDDEEAIYWNQRASDLGCATASYNMGFFYYSGFVGLDQNLKTAKKYWLLSASQYLDEDNICDSNPDELLKEINDYNPNPTVEMIQLRDFFIVLLKSENKKI